MWLVILLVYCLVCWGAAMAMTRFWAPQFAERAAVHGISPASFEMRAVLIAPLAMPLIVCAVVPALVKNIRRHRQLRKCLTTVREYEFAKVNSLYLAEPVRRSFEQHTPALFQLGFELLGDYRMKPQPVEVHDRIFLSADGQSLATICALLKGGGISFISILADGTCVHTSSTKNPRPERTLEPADQLSISYWPGVSIEEVHRQHLTALQDQSVADGCSAIRQTADQFREVLIYDQRIFNRWRFRHGDLPKEPPAPDFQTLSVNF